MMKKRVQVVSSAQRQVVALLGSWVFAGVALAASPTVEVVASGLQNPWGLAFIGEGRMLVTERPGRMRVVQPDGQVGAPLAGLPPVEAVGQGGLLDVVTDRDFARNRTLYFCYAEPARCPESP
jgi:aldose sugar dehydrogenase